MTVTVGIAGITGKLAQALAVSLLKHHEVNIRGYCRTPSKVPSSLPSSPKSRLIEGTAFDAEKVSSFVKGCDVVVCCYLGDDKIIVEGQKLLIESCEEEKVPRYVASDWALDYTRLELGVLFPKDPNYRGSQKI